MIEEDNQTRNRFIIGLSKYPLIIITTVCSIALCSVFIPKMYEEDIEKISYQLDNKNIKEMYQNKCVPVIQKAIQTKSLPDVKITVDECTFINFDVDQSPIYSVNFHYSSQIIDEYYDSAMESKSAAKELFSVILEVNARKNSFEARSESFWMGEKYHSDRKIVEFNESDRFIMTIKSDQHTYKIVNHQWNDCLYIDNQLVYELEKDGPDSSGSSNHNQPSSNQKPEQPSNQGSSSSGSSSNSNKYDSYDDGYNSVIEDGDYDYDRYYEDDDYRNGVDDALDEMDEDY